MDLKTLRKELKAIGFGFSTKRLSWGRHVTYKHLASGHKMSGNVFTPETLERWQPLLDYLEENKSRLSEIAENEGERIYGLNPS